MPLHAVFTPEGIPGWIGFNPRPGSEELPETIRLGDVDTPVTIEVLAGHLRTAAGEWVPRPPPPPPTEEELAAQAQALADAAVQAEVDARQRIEEEIARRAQPDALLRAMGKITIAELNLRVAAIRAEVEAMG